MEGELRGNIVAARNVLQSHGWCAAGVFGRQFSISDLRPLIELATGDPLFSWERELQDSEYFQSLLNLRLRHYQKYGFGVHGIWLEDRLVGQCGLQVLNEDLDRVEMVIFLGNAFTHRGLGSQLSRYLVLKCRECGMTALYGVARTDNPEAIALMVKLAAVRLEDIIHFRRKATVFALDLTKEVR